MIKSKDKSKKERGLLEKFKAKGVCIVPTKPTSYESSRNTLVGYLTKSLKLNGVYVTINKPYDKIHADLKKENIDISKLYFIDCISKRENKKLKTNNYEFIEDRNLLVGLSIAITDALNTGKYQFLIFDSITDLLKRTNLNSTVRFLHYLIGKLLILELSGILLCLDDPKSKKVVLTITPHIEQFTVYPKGYECVDLDILEKDEIF